VAGCREYGDEPSGSGATDFLKSRARQCGFNYTGSGGVRCRTS
jgi:hypothetical protein